MKIDVLCNDGSPIGVVEDDIHGKIPPRIGVGGAELGLLTMCAAWKFYGHDVTLYNNPREIGRSSFRQENLSVFDPNEFRDVLIIFRSPNPLVNGARGRKIWWSCDQFTVGNFKEFSQAVNKVVTISPYHSEYFKNVYGIADTVSIDIPVRTWEYPKNPEKVVHRCVFTSIPDRGLMPLNAAWPLIQRDVPDASLVITSDWRLWVDWANEDMIRPYKLAFARQPGITYLGATSRSRLIEEQSKAQVHLYPCQYEELFCISVAESQVAGAYPISSDAGALRTTNMGTILHGNPSDPQWVELFVKKAVEFLTDPHLAEKQRDLAEIARNRFSLETIMKKWDEVLDG